MIDEVMECCRGECNEEEGNDERRGWRGEGEGMGIECIEKLEEGERDTGMLQREM